MRRRLLPLWALLTLFFVAFLNFHNVQANSGATEELRSTIASLQMIFSRVDVSGAEKLNAARTIALEKMDFTEMSRRILRRHLARTDLEFENFVSTFSRFMDAVYLAKIVELEGATVDYISEESSGESVFVLAVITKGENKVKVNFSMRRAGADWRVYNVTVSTRYYDFDLVNKYYIEANQILEKKKRPFRYLLQKFEEKISEKTAQ